MTPEQLGVLCRDHGLLTSREFAGPRLTGADRRRLRRVRRKLEEYHYRQMNPDLERLAREADDMEELAREVQLLVDATNGIDHTFPGVER